MKALYLLLNIGSFSIPFLYSFHPKMDFKKHWKALLTSTTLVAIIFIIWDYIFTLNGVWGFNSDYFLGPKFFNMPFEEVLFFFCIPYSSIFIHHALLYFLPSCQLKRGLTKGITLSLIVMAIMLMIIYYSRAYSFVAYMFLTLTLGIAWFKGLPLLDRFYISFLIILVPFFIVNGILTGSFILEPVVWYNNQENMNIRLFTIPVEDITYAFSMIFMNLMIMNKLENKL
jgi:lycopene cyclase domain-containing protein